MINIQHEFGVNLLRIIENTSDRFEILLTRRDDFIKDISAR